MSFALLGTTCTKDCGTAKFNNVGTKTCDDCLADCDTCLDKDTCTACASTFYLKEGVTCTKDCGDEYFKNDVNS